MDAELAECLDRADLTDGHGFGTSRKGALVYFGLEDEKRAELEVFAKERGVTLEELVSEAVAMFLEEKRESE